MHSSFLLGLEPETVVYSKIATLTNAQQKDIDKKIKTIKSGGSVALSGLTVKTSNATGYLFLTNPSVDLRWLKGFYLTLNDGSKNLKVLVGDGGTGETTSAIYSSDFSAGED